MLISFLIPGQKLYLKIPSFDDGGGWGGLEVGLEGL